MSSASARGAGRGDARGGVGRGRAATRGGAGRGAGHGRGGGASRCGMCGKDFSGPAQLAEHLAGQAHRTKLREKQARSAAGAAVAASRASAGRGGNSDGGRGGPGAAGAACRSVLCAKDFSGPAQLAEHLAGQKHRTRRSCEKSMQARSAAASRASAGRVGSAGAGRVCGPTQLAEHLVGQPTCKRWRRALGDSCERRRNALVWVRLLHASPRFRRGALGRGMPPNTVTVRCGLTIPRRPQPSSRTAS